MSIYNDSYTLLPGQYGDSLYLRKLLDALLGTVGGGGIAPPPVAIAEIELVLQLLKGNIWLGNATGVHLDRLGVILGCPRAGLADEPYRFRLRIQVMMNVGTGLAEQLIAFCVLLWAPQWVQVLESYPETSIPFSHQTAKVYLCLRMAAAGALPDGITDLFQKFAPAGVGLWLTSAENQFPFGFLDDPLADGFDEVDLFHVVEGIGGAFPELYPHAVEV